VFVGHRGVPDTMFGVESAASITTLHFAPLASSLLLPPRARLSRVSIEREEA
jgi:hypothetical protein